MYLSDCLLFRLPVSLFAYLFVCLTISHLLAECACPSMLMCWVLACPRQWHPRPSCCPLPMVLGLSLSVCLFFCPSIITSIDPKPYNDPMVTRSHLL